MLPINSYYNQITNYYSWNNFNARDTKTKISIIIQILFFSFAVGCLFISLYKRMYKKGGINPNPIDNSVKRVFKGHTKRREKVKSPLPSTQPPLIPSTSAPLTLPPPPGLTSPQGINQKKQFSLPTKGIEQAFISPSFFSAKIVPPCQIDKPPQGISILRLLELYDKLNQPGKIPDLIKTEGYYSVPKKEYLAGIKSKIREIDKYVNNHDWQPPVMIESSDVKKIYHLLLHITGYLEGLDKSMQDKEEIEKNKISDQIKNTMLDIAEAFEHCGDRVTGDLEQIYYTCVVGSLIYVDGLSLEQQVLQALQIDRREVFTQSVYEVLYPVIQGKEPESHYAATNRYYWRIGRGPFGLGGMQDPPSFWEEKPAYCVRGYEAQVRRQFLKNYTSQHVLNTVMELIHSQNKGHCIKSEMVHQYVNDHYDLLPADQEQLLDEDGMSWNPRVILKVLIDFNILTLPA